jgi:hypothetical protein
MNWSRALRRSSLFAAMIVLLGSESVLVAEPVWYFRSGDVALSGYDPVAYFTESRAVKGRVDFETTWNGARWRFVSHENRDRFVKDPLRYAPQFGGYCAYAVSKGYTASADALAWSVVNGKLYVNYSMSVRQEWEKDRDARIASAEANWPGVVEKK